MASASFDDSNYTGWFEVDSTAADVDEAVGDLMIDLGTHAPSEFWSNAASDGGDVRITDDTGETAYSFELENFDTGAETGILFFDSQAISTSSSVTLRIYAGNGSTSMPANTDTLGRNNVWTAYEAVWHLGESSGSAIDSTGNGHDGTFQGDLPTQVSGQLGNAQDADGTGDYITQDLKHDFTDGTFLWWSNPDQNVGARREFWFGEQDDTGAPTDDELALRNDKNGFAGYRIHIDGTSSEVQVTDSFPSGWFMQVFTWASNGNIEIYWNGTSKGTDTIGSITSVDHPFWIGAQNANGAIQSNPIDGGMDEARFMSGEQSSNWQQTHYNNQSDNASFWTAGTWQTGSVSVTVDASSNTLTFTNPEAKVSIPKIVSVNTNTLSLDNPEESVTGLANISAGTNVLTLTNPEEQVNGLANIQAGTNTLTFSNPDVVVKGDAYVNLATNNLIFANPAVDVETSDEVVVNPGSITLNLSNPSPDLQYDYVVKLGTATLTLDNPSPGITGKANLHLDTNTLNFGIPEETATGDANISAGTIDLTLNNPTVAVNTETIISPGTNTLSFTNPDVVLSRSVVVDVETNTITFNAVSPYIDTGWQWESKPSAMSPTWESKPAAGSWTWEDKE